MLNPIEPKKRRREIIRIKIKRGELLLESRGEKKWQRGATRGRKEQRELL